MHTFRHDPTGLTIHHNGDYSGDALVLVSESSLERCSDSDGRVYYEMTVPCAALVAFSREAVLDAAVVALEGLY